MTGIDAMTGVDAMIGLAQTRHLGIDLGATNLKWTMLAHDTGHDDEWTVVAHDQAPTRLTSDAEAVPAMVVAQLAEVARHAIDSSGPAETIGIGLPGLYDPATGTARFLVNVPGPWAGQPVAGPVSEATGLPVRLINDARAFGLAELRLGAGRGAQSLVGLTLGTGVGGVIAIDGSVHQGHDGTAGEIGHQTIDPDGPWCGCGNRGCLEAYARADQIAAACGAPTAEEAVARARTGDADAVRGLAQVGRYLGIGIANMITVVTPDRVVIGGGIAGALDLLAASIRQELQARVRTTALDEVDIVSAELGIWAGAIGAAVHGAEGVETAAAAGARRAMSGVALP
jgi:glucokinase